MHSLFTRLFALNMSNPSINSRSFIDGSIIPPSTAFQPTIPTMKLTLLLLAVCASVVIANPSKGQAVCELEESMYFMTDKPEQGCASLPDASMIMTGDPMENACNGMEHGK